MTADPLPDLVISADSHVGEPEALRKRLPERFRARLPELTVDADGNLVFKVNGKVVHGPPERKPTAEDLLREFRSDPSQGTDLERRLHDMAVEGVDGQVIFPNIGLCCSLGDEDAEYYQAWARAHNDLVWDLFNPYQHRFKPAGMIPIDDIDLAVAEAERCIERGFCTLFLPAVVPWQPYWMSVYEGGLNGWTQHSNL